jgi:MFS family permease
MEAHFAGDPAASVLVRQVLTIPSLAIALSAPLSGIITDRIGRRLPLAFGLALFGIAGTAGYFLDSLAWILVSRACLGIAIALITTSTTALIADYYQGDARAYFMALQAALMGMGGVVFLAGGGLLAEWGWRPPFLIHVVGLLIVPAVYLVLWQSDRPTEPGVPDDTAMPRGIVAFLFMAVFVGMGAFYFMLVQVPFRLAALGVSTTVSGAAIGLSTLAGVFTSLAYPRLKRRLHFAPILAATFLLVGAGLAIIGLADFLGGVIAGLLVLGLGIGMLMPNCSLWLTVRVPAPLRGRAVGIYSTGIFLGQFVSPLAVQPLVEGPGLPTAFLVVGGLVGLLGVLVGFKRV